MIYIDMLKYIYTYILIEGYRLIGFETLILVLGYIASLFMAWCIGANDASNPTETAVGAGVLSIRKALILFSIFAGVGALLQGWMVMKTLGKGVVVIEDVVSAMIAVLSAGLWIIIASWKGLPISTSQSIAGGVLGIGFAYVLMGRIGLYDINWSVVFKIILSWITSPLASMFLAAILFFSFEKISWKTRGSGGINLLFKYLLILSLIFSAYSFGANDVGNATGVYVAVTQKYLGLPTISTRIFLAILGSIGIAIGGFTLGRRVISTVAYKITRLDLLTGLAAELSNALTVWLFTTIPYLLFGYGMPISTTHASVASIIGVGL
ncbi:MAG: hypothetical protein B6U89_05090, partial [Desulfurococcales archaeon ex4484_58]